MAKKLSTTNTKNLKHITPKLRQFAVPIDTLKLDPDNANQHNSESLTKIAASLEEFGQQLPILVGPRSIVKHGNGVLEAARDILQWKHVAAMPSNLKGLKLDALAIAVNRTAEFSKWNKPALAEKISAIAAEDEKTLSAVGFGDDVNDILEMLDGNSRRSAASEKSGKKTIADVGITIGGYRWSVKRKAYEKWLEDLRQAPGFDEEAVIDEMKRRLGL